MTLAPNDERVTRNAEIYDDLSTEIRETAFRAMPEQMIEHFRKQGSEESFEPGEHLFKAGDAETDFFIVLEGQVDFVDTSGPEEILLGTGSDNGFIGELSLLTGQAAFATCRVAKTSRILRVPLPKLFETINMVPEISDIVVSALAARREVVMRTARENLTIVGSRKSAGVTRALEFANRNRLPHRWLEPGTSEADRFIEEKGLDPDTLTVFVRGKKVERPDNPGIAHAIGMHLEIEDGALADLAVIGAGPGGLAAAVYGASEGLETVVVEDTAIGGQAGTSSRIENYMGFPTGISGADLAYRGQVQSLKFGARYASPRTVRGVERVEDGYRLVLCNGNDICARSLVVATGVQYRRLPLDRLDEFEGAGVYYAATELEAKFCRNTEAVIVGGGNSAGQAAMFLSRTAKHVHLVVRSGDLAPSMSSYLSQRLEADPRITLHFHAEVETLHGDDALQAVTLKNSETGESRRMKTTALFIMIGAAPRTEWLEGICDLDEKGFVHTGLDHGGRSTFETSCHGIFAIGDVRAGSVKRVASAVGEGSVVVSAVHQHLAARESA